MKRVYGSGLVIGLLTVVLGSGLAYGHGFGGHGHGGGGESELMPPVVGMIAGHSAIHSVMSADKANLQSLFSAEKTAHETLVQDLASGSSNVPTDLTNLQTAQNNLLAEKVKLAQQVYAGLSSTQKGQVSSFLTQWTALKQSQQQARMALFQQFKGSQAAQSDTP
jgi:hypothetical protein